MASDNVFNVFRESQLPLELSPISIRELLFINTAPCDIYGIEDDHFANILIKGTYINKTIIRDLIIQGQIHLFVHHEYRHLLIEKVQESLIQTARSLSMGKSFDKAKKLTNLLTINLGHLYRDPINDEMLKQQYICAKSLAYFLMKNIHFIEPLYNDLIEQKHHYTYMQPLISSLLVLGILKQSNAYSDQDIEALFITSYFKDIGMSSIPAENFDKDELTIEEKALLTKHPEFSVTILANRLPLLPSHLAIIKNHHAFSLLNSEINEMTPSLTSKGEIIGFETVVVSVMDIVAAMITPRPYRDKLKVFESLDLIRVLIADKYPSEFRMMVSFFKNFFLNR